MRGQQAFEHDFSALDFCRVELAFHGEPDLLLLERIQNVGFRDGLVALVFDPADDRPLRDVEHHDFPIRLVGIVFRFEPDVFEELRVPERLKIAANCVRSVGITHARKDAREQRIALDSAVPVKFDAGVKPGSFGSISGLQRTLQNIGTLGSFVLALSIAAASIPKSVAFQIFLGTLTVGVNPEFINGIDTAFYVSLGILAIAGGCHSSGEKTPE